MDGPCNGPPPGTWDIYQAKPQPFVQTTFYHVVPHTEEVRNRDLPIKSLTGLGQYRDPWLGVVTIVVERVGIGVIIAKDLVQSVKEMHKEIMYQKIVIFVTGVATGDAMYVMAQEKTLRTIPVPYDSNEI